MSCFGGTYVTNRYRADWNRMRSALIWKYGSERTAEILAGRDPEANADLLAWRTLGEKTS